MEQLGLQEPLESLDQLELQVLLAMLEQLD
jgi:hypothetical protein